MICFLLNNLPPHTHVTEHVLAWQPLWIFYEYVFANRALELAVHHFILLLRDRDYNLVFLALTPIDNLHLGASSLITLSHRDLAVLARISHLRKRLSFLFAIFSWHIFS